MGKDCILESCTADLSRKASYKIKLKFSLNFLDKKRRVKILKLLSAIHVRYSRTGYRRCMTVLSIIFSAAFCVQRPVSAAADSDSP